MATAKDGAHGTRIEKPRSLTFVELLGEVNSGQTIKELNNGLRNLSSAVHRTSGKGMIALKIEMKSVSNEDPEVVCVTDEIKVRIPEIRPPALLFVNRRGQLGRQAWKQGRLPFAPVAGDEKTG